MKYNNRPVFTLYSIKSRSSNVPIFTDSIYWRLRVTYASWYLFKNESGKDNSEKHQFRTPFKDKLEQVPIVSDGTTAPSILQHSVPISRSCVEVEETTATKLINKSDLIL